MSQKIEFRIKLMSIIIVIIIIIIIIIVIFFFLFFIFFFVVVYMSEISNYGLCSGIREINRIMRIKRRRFFFQEGDGEEGESVGSDVEGELHWSKFLINCFALNCLEKSAIFCGSVSYSYQGNAKWKEKSLCY